MQACFESGDTKKDKNKCSSHSIFCTWPQPHVRKTERSLKYFAVRESQAAMFAHEKGGVPGLMLKLVLESYPERVTLVWTDTRCTELATKALEKINTEKYLSSVYFAVSVWSMACQATKLSHFTWTRPS